MDANQLAEALARAVEAAKPAAEYCLLAKQDYWWTVCMTKAEWSGWMQAMGSVIALVVAIGVPYVLQRRVNTENFGMAKECLHIQCALLHSISIAAGTRPGGYRSAISAARESVSNLLLMYREVRPSLLSQIELICWLTAQTTAGQLSEFITNVAAGKVADKDMEPAIKQLLDSSVEQLKDLTQARVGKSGA
ncbi:MAG: hypothetical protein QE485_10830 [Acidovorax sp.]|uniref:hypothetical protein n=1 Tax=Acidovorax sp. TaxID=1872122 RepID=UPI0026224EA1|nr:hypothetical protein [Acidovorax sp.]MDH4417710.1 hypothetical protein [Acidovorax sp.]